MATTSQLQIVPFPTTEEIALTLLQWMFASIGIPSDYNVGSIIRTYSEALGSVNEIEGITAQAEAIQALVYSAYAAFNISPLPATGAVGTVTFSTLSSAPLPSGQSVLIPAGTIVQTTSAIQFATTANALLVSGTSSINASIQAVTLGSTSNVVANTIIQIITGLSYPLSVINSAPTAGGANAETPSQTLTRFLAYVDSLGLCSPIAVASAVIGQSYLEETVLYSTCYEPWVTEVQNNETPVAGYTCYDDQTEILTKDGWYKFEDLVNKPFCEVATLNPNTHELEYQNIEYYHKYWYEGKLINFDSDSYNFAVTPDHNMYVCPDSPERRDTGTIKYVNNPINWEMQSAELVNKYSKIKTNCRWEGVEQEDYNISGIVNHKLKLYTISMDLWLEFLGYYLSEGSCTYYINPDKNDGHGQTHHRRVTITQYKEDTVKIIGICLNKFPLKFHRDKAGWVANDKLLYGEVEKFGVCNEKFVPYYIKNLSKRQIKIFLDALFLGDGTFNEDGTYQSLSTTSAKLADDVQELLLKIGIVGNIMLRTDHIGKSSTIFNKYTNKYITITSKLPNYIVHVRNQRFNSSLYYGNKSITNYNNFVYCVTVPNHIIYVRRNGKAAWCGNCYIDNGTGAASANLISVVTTYLSNGTINNIPIGFRPAGVPFTVEAVNPVNCSVQITGTSINSALASSIQTAITQSLSAYFASIGFNTTVELTQITAAVANASFGQLTSLSVSLYNGSSPVNSIAATGPGQRIISTSNVVVIN